MPAGTVAQRGRGAEGGGEQAQESPSEHSTYESQEHGSRIDTIAVVLKRLGGTSPNSAAGVGYVNAALPFVGPIAKAVRILADTSGPHVGAVIEAGHVGVGVEQ